MKKVLLVCLVMAMIVAMMIGCAQNEEPAAPAEEVATEEAAPAEEAAEEPTAEAMSLEDLVVGFSQMENNMPWRIAETNSMKNEAEARGVKLIYTDAQSDTAKQASDIENLIAQQVDYLLIAPREYEGLEAVIAQAADAGIPVFMIDRDAVGERLTYIHPDIYREGQWCADILAETLGGKGKVVELTGTEGSSVAIERHDGFVDRLAEKYPDIEVIVSQTAEFSRINGKDVMANILQSHSDEIDAVYAHNDEMGLGAIEAIEAGGRFVCGDDILIVSIDGQKSGVQAVLDGKFVCTVECSPFFGPIAFDTIEAHLAGDDIPEEIYIDDRIFTLDGGIVGGLDTIKAADVIDDAF